MRILAIDAATKTMGVAVAESDKLLASARLNIGKTHSERLLPLLSALLETSDIPAESIDAVAVTVGPGSFTGLRIGISSAKALASAWKKPLIPVITLDALAMSQADCGKIVCPILDARRNEVYYAVYDENGKQLTEPGAMAPKVLAEHLAATYPNREIVLLGDACEIYFDMFKETCGEGLRLAPPDRRFFLAEGAAFWALEHPEAAQEAALVKAFYLRLSEAEARRKAAENAGA